MGDFGLWTHEAEQAGFVDVVSFHSYDGNQSDMRQGIASARALADLEHVHGLDLLAYRFDGDVPGLMGQVAQAVSKPVIVAGSIDSEARIGAVAEAGAAADLASSASSMARVAPATSLCSLSTSTIGTVLAAGLLLLLGAPEGVKII